MTRSPPAGRSALRPGWVGPALLAAPALWTLIDERILLAAGLALFAGLISVSPGLLITGAWHLIVPAALVTVAAVLAHRRAKTF
jgi:CHASE2 domain-containing sensor protein